MFSIPKRIKIKIALIASIVIGVVVTVDGQSRSPSPRTSLTPEEIASRVLPSVVSIEMTNGAKSQSGSGFFISSDIIATNFHVIEGMTNGTVRIVGGTRTYDISSVVNFNDNADLALIKISESVGTALLLSPSEKPAIGSSVFAVGNPRGLEGTFSPGVVSGLRDFSDGALIQITAPISRGSSGGPVVNGYAEVIGIAVGSFEAGQALNFAIPVSALRELQQNLGRNIPVAQAGRVRKGRVGSVIENSIGIQFSWIPSGRFMMGLTQRQFEMTRLDCENRGILKEICSNLGKNQIRERLVAIPEGFWMGKFEVTQGQYEAVMGTNPSHFIGCGKDCPVENVSWDQVKEFIARLNARNDGFIYSLPSEAEWEYSARAGSSTFFAFGDSLSSAQANFDGNKPFGGAPKGPYLESTTMVGRYQPNAWGLHDMHGNVFELVEDDYADDVGPYTYWWMKFPTDGSAFAGDPLDPRPHLRVIRGGSWLMDALSCRTAVRTFFNNSWGSKGSETGFRIVARAK